MVSLFLLVCYLLFFVTISNECNNLDTRSRRNRFLRPVTTLDMPICGSRSTIDCDRRPTETNGISFDCSSLPSGFEKCVCVKSLQNRHIVFVFDLNHQSDIQFQFFTQRFFQIYFDEIVTQQLNINYDIIFYGNKKIKSFGSFQSALNWLDGKNINPWQGSESKLCNALRVAINRINNKRINNDLGIIIINTWSDTTDLNVCEQISSDIKYDLRDYLVYGIRQNINISLANIENTLGSFTACQYIWNEAEVNSGIEIDIKNADSILRSIIPSISDFVCTSFFEFELLPLTIQPSINNLVLTNNPTLPSISPTNIPSINPISNPKTPTQSPTIQPTNQPTDEPSDKPSLYPSHKPSINPTTHPIECICDSEFPTVSPHKTPTKAPIRVTKYPTNNPITWKAPTQNPTRRNSAWKYPTRSPGWQIGSDDNGSSDDNNEGRSSDQILSDTIVYNQPASSSGGGSDSRSSEAKIESKTKVKIRNKSSSNIGGSSIGSDSRRRLLDDCIC